MTDEPTTCVIIGGGPAGMVAGLILARCGLSVTVLEKHGDFRRDFRGDTIHPTTLEVLDELGLYDRFQQIPHTEIAEVTIEGENGRSLTIADLRRLHLKYPFIALAPQWDFLNLLAEAGRDEPSFRLIMNADVVGLLREDGRTTGVRYRAEGGDRKVSADLTIAADGRWSLARRAAGLPVADHPVGFDLWWFRVPADDADLPASILPHATRGNLFIAIPRRGYVQMARAIPKGADQRLRRRGVGVLRDEIAAAMPALGEAAGTLDLNEVALLDVRIDHLRRWYEPGLLCIGDAAHAMSPIGGVGVNLAVADGVAAARLLARPLRNRAVQVADLRSVQRRRRLPTAATQTLQRLMHRMLRPVIDGRAGFDPPRWVEQMLRRLPGLTAIPARLLAVGPRPEHVPRQARRPPVPQHAD